MVLDNYYIGTELKFRLEIQAEGFDMDDDDFTVTLICGQKKKVYAKGDLVQDEQNNWYILINTNEFRDGTLRMVVKAEVPDLDFSDDSKRTEVAVVDLCKLSYGQSYGLS